jgi:predicted RNase H-like HicB family nuclease
MPSNPRTKPVKKSLDQSLSDIHNCIKEEFYKIPLGASMKNEFTAVFEKDGDFYVGYCLEVPGANGLGKTIEECRESLSQSIALILEDRRQDAQKGIPREAIQEILLVG